MYYSSLCVLDIGTEEYHNLEMFARELAKQCPNGHTYRVEETYLDFSQTWKCTTIIDRGGDAPHIAITSTEWKDIVNNTGGNFEMMVQKHFLSQDL